MPINEVMGHKRPLFPLHMREEIFELVRGNFLEIGSFEGYNLRILAENYPDKTIYGIDPFISDGWVPNYGLTDLTESMKKTKKILYNNIEGFNNIEFFETQSSDFLSNFSRKQIESFEIDICLIDGFHTKEMAMIDLCVAELALGLNADKKDSTVKFLLLDDTHVKEIHDIHDLIEEKYENIITETLHFDGNPVFASVFRFW